MDRQISLAVDVFAGGVVLEFGRRRLAWLFNQPAGWRCIICRGLTPRRCMATPPCSASMECWQSACRCFVCAYRATARCGKTARSKFRFGRLTSGLGAMVFLSLLPQGILQGDGKLFGRLLVGARPAIHASTDYGILRLDARTRRHHLHRRRAGIGLVWLATVARLDIKRQDRGKTSLGFLPSMARAKGCSPLSSIGCLASDRLLFARRFF